MKGKLSLFYFHWFYFRYAKSMEIHRKGENGNGNTVKRIKKIMSESSVSWCVCLASVMAMARFYLVYN